jgi:hypothetical protein
MSTERTGWLDIAPHLNSIIAVREDGAKLKVGATELSVAGLAEVAGDTDQMVIASGKTVTFSNTLTFAGTDGTTMTFPATTGTVATIGLANTWALAQTFTTAIVPTGGVGAAGGFTASARGIHTGGAPAKISTEGTNLDIVVTELYVAEVNIPHNCTVTGVAVLWGTNTNGNAKVMLFNSAGARVAISASTDVSAFTGASYGTNIAFTSTYAAKGPATYYVGVICDDNTNDVRTHILGAFGAGKIESLVYATEAGYATITVPTTFTTGLGPIASLY